MLLINCKVELKLRWSKHCVLSGAGTDNANGNNADDNVTLSAEDNQKLSKFLSKGFERSVYWNDSRKKMRIKIQQTNIDIFLNQTLLESIDYLF